MATYSHQYTGMNVMDRSDGKRIRTIEGGWIRVLWLLYSIHLWRLNSSNELMNSSCVQEFAPVIVVGFSSLFS